ncbi:hypothetical protein SJAV_12230 [Sulfurisphaera javensis]|uniref:Uncharacterized protein n=1 Tax=Sulfurisphaera javensis TaxID=2049879 RepID=A0AAT9GR35_9CREN
MIDISISDLYRYELNGLYVRGYKLTINGKEILLPIKALSRKEIISKQYTPANLYIPDHVFLVNIPFKPELKAELIDKIYELKKLMSDNNKLFLVIPSIQGKLSQVEKIRSLLNGVIEFQKDIENPLLFLPLNKLKGSSIQDIISSFAKTYQNIVPIIGFDPEIAKNVISNTRIKMLGIIFNKRINTLNKIWRDLVEFNKILNLNNIIPIVTGLPESFTVTLSPNRQKVMESTSIFRYFFPGILSYSSSVRITTSKKPLPMPKIWEEGFRKSFIVDPVTHEARNLQDVVNDDRFLSETKSFIDKFTGPDKESAKYLLTRIEEAARENSEDKLGVIVSLTKMLNSLIINKDFEEFHKDPISSNPTIINTFRSLLNQKWE